MGYIYCFKNLINGKCYIGQTIRNPKVRYAQHLNTDDGTVFHNALKKYGYKNFLFYVIGEFPDSQLDEKEKFYIKQFNSHWKDGNGYNMSYGGANSPDITRKLISAYRLFNDYTPDYKSRRIFSSLSEACRILSKETGKKFNTSNITVICQGKRYSIFGYTFCYLDENNNDIPTGYEGYIDYHQASKNNIKKCHEKNSIPIVLYSPWKEAFYYNSIKEAGRVHHIDPKTIKKLCEEKREISSGPNKGWRAEYMKKE